MSLALGVVCDSSLTNCSKNEMCNEDKLCECGETWSNMGDFGSLHENERFGCDQNLIIIRSVALAAVVVGFVAVPVLIRVCKFHHSLRQYILSSTAFQQSLFSLLLLTVGILWGFLKAINPKKELMGISAKYTIVTCTLTFLMMVGYGYFLKLLQLFIEEHSYLISNYGKMFLRKLIRILKSTSGLVLAVALAGSYSPVLCFIYPQQMSKFAATYYASIAFMFSLITWSEYEIGRCIHADLRIHIMQLADNEMDHLRLFYFRLDAALFVWSISAPFCICVVLTCAAWPMAQRYSAMLFSVLVILGMFIEIMKNVLFTPPSIWSLSSPPATTDVDTWNDGVQVGDEREEDLPPHGGEAFPEGGSSRSADGEEFVVPEKGAFGSLIIICEWLHRLHLNLELQCSDGHILIRDERTASSE